MTTCTKCNAEGIIGAGDKPWLKEGALRTCPDCLGTGRVPDTENVSQETPAPAPVDNSADTTPTTPADQTQTETSSEPVLG